MKKIFIIFLIIFSILSLVSCAPKTLYHVNFTYVGSVNASVENYYYRPEGGDWGIVSGSFRVLEPGNYDFAADIYVLNKWWCGKQYNISINNDRTITFNIDEFTNSACYGLPGYSKGINEECVTK